MIKVILFSVLLLLGNTCNAESSPDYFRSGDLKNGSISSRVENPSRSGTIGYYSVKVIPDYYGKTGNFSIDIKGTDIQGWAGLWIHTTDAKNEVLGFDNMSDRPIKSTTSWKRYENTIYIPKNAKSISFGVLLHGEGQVEFKDFNFFID